MKRNRKFVHISIVVLLLLIVIIIKNEYAWKLMENNQFGMPALIKDGSVEELWIGSSAFRQGIDIRGIEKETGKNIWMLSYNGNQPVFENMELQYLLGHNVKIETIYLDMYAYAAQEEPWISDNKLLLETDLDFKCNLWKELVRTGEADLNDFYQLFVSSNNEQLLIWPISNRLVNTRFYRGGSISVMPSASKEKLDSLYVKDTPNHMNPVQKAALTEIFDTVEQNEIQLTLVETPKYITATESGEYLSLMQEFVELAAEHEIPVWLTRNTADNLKKPGSAKWRVMEFNQKNPDHFADLVHMSAKGREKFTELLSN